MQWTTPWWTHIFCFFPSPPSLYPRGSITVSCRLLSLLQKLTRNPNRPLKGRALLNRAIYSYGQLSSKLCRIHFQGKPHTAVAKFREAMQENFQQLEALFNICLQYRKLGNFVAEIQCLKLLKQVRRKMKLADREFDNYCNVITCNFDLIVTPGQAYPPRFH